MKLTEPESQFSLELIENVNDLYGKGNNRISLAYGQFVDMPMEIIANIADKIQFLDLSYNDFRNLSFLSYFSDLQTLILDRNYNLQINTFPLLENVKIVWLNNCNIINTHEWLQKLSIQCPNLNHLSMMCNPVGPTTLNGVTNAEEQKYRKQVFRILPQLRYFDGLKITPYSYKF